MLVFGSEVSTTVLSNLKEISIRLISNLFELMKLYFVLMCLIECRFDSDCPSATPVCQVGECRGMFCYNTNKEDINHNHAHLFEP